MKAATFAYERPANLAEAAGLLADEDNAARVLAGGQSLGPMLNLRLATPQMLVDVRRIPEMKRADVTSNAVTYGACTTHAAIEDGKLPDGTRGILPRIARGIAYRAVRNRGTVGGSLAHADPAADWITCLSALGADALVYGAGGARRIPIAKLMVGPFETALAPGELIEGIRIPTASARARWGFCKIARKAGKFADAMSAVLWDPERNVARAVMGAMEARPVVIEDASWMLENRDALDMHGGREPSALDPLKKAGLAGDRFAIQVHLVALRRALAQAHPQ